MAPRLPRIGQASIFADEGAAEASHASHARVADLSAQGKHEEARNALSHMLATEKVASGVHSPEYRHALASATRLCNELALGAMERTSRQRSGNGFDVALGYLRKALALGTGTPPLQALSQSVSQFYTTPSMGHRLTRSRPSPDERVFLSSLQALTLNNLAVYYNGTGQPRQALRCLQRTRRMCRRPDDDDRAELDVPDDDVSTHALLNMTTVLAALGRHHEAMQVAEEAVAIVRSQGREEEQHHLLPAAYHNLGVQKERLRAASAAAKHAYGRARHAARATADGGTELARFVEREGAQAEREVQAAAVRRGRAWRSRTAKMDRELAARREAEEHAMAMVVASEAKHARRAQQRRARLTGSMGGGRARQHAA